MAIPTFDDLFNPLLLALKELGGSGSNSEIDEKVGEILKLSEKDLSHIHRGNMTELTYRLAWSRNYLKRFGLLENSIRGIWALTKKGKEVSEVDKDEVKRFVRSLRDASSVQEEVEEGKEPSDAMPLWQDKLLFKIQSLSPAGFERLCQRVLREAGFIQVEITGKSGDGGIDGTGVMRLGGFLSFNVIFQCKRYQSSVSAQLVRDFRGAMVGRADKGLIITTGTFTRDAKKEALRDGAPHIDLIDGDMLIEKMKELNLGIKTKTQEVVEVDSDWFRSF